MAKQRNLRFVVWLRAALCIGVAVVTANAQPAAGPPKIDERAAPRNALPRENGDTPAPPGPARDDHRAKKDVRGDHSDHVIMGKGKGPSVKGADTPEIRMKDLGPVDTRITAPPQPHRTDERKQNPPLHAPTGLRTQPPHTHRPGSATTRNSIGEAVPSSAQPAARAPSQGSSPGTMAPAVTAHGSGGPGNATAAPGNPALAPFHVHPIAAAPQAPRSTINATIIARRGNSPGGIGGQAKPLADINGSTIRPKH